MRCAVAPQRALRGGADGNVSSGSAGAMFCSLEPLVRAVLCTFVYGWPN